MKNFDVFAASPENLGKVSHFTVKDAEDNERWIIAWPGLEAKADKKEQPEEARESQIGGRVHE